MKRTTKNRPPDNVVKIAALAAALSLVLAACASMIPDQDVTDPFGLDGQTAYIHFGDPALRPLPLAVDGGAEAGFTLDDFAAALPVNPTSLSNELRVASASLTGSDGPDELALSNIEVNLRVWEGTAGYDGATRKASATLASDATVVLSKRGCATDSCDYGVISGSDLGSLALRGVELATFLDIMTSGAPKNQGQVSISLGGSPDDLAGNVLSIVLGAEAGRISFK